jgi:predicted DsbA family dithiol-disulfide isomerase
MADQLFEHQRELSDEKILELAKGIGLDIAKFQADLASEAVATRVDKDRKDGEAVKIEGTPTLFVNGRRFRENPPNLSKYLREELGQ